MANHLWQSTLFALLAAILALALRKNQARVRHRLWLAASLKFLIPFSLLTSLGAHLATLNHSAETQTGLYFVIQEVSQPFAQTPAQESGYAASLLPLLPGILAVGVALRFCRRDRDIVVALAADHCGDALRGAHISRP